MSLYKIIVHHGVGTACEGWIKVSTHVFTYACITMHALQIVMLCSVCLSRVNALLLLL